VTDKYEYGGGNDNQHRALRMRVLTMLMRWSGLSILDATSLERERLSTNENGDDQIFLYRAKTGVPVNVVIPAEVGEALRTLPNSHPTYFFTQRGERVPTLLLETFQVGGCSEAIRNAKAVPPAYVP
jgi:hypothetical protein